MIYFCSVNRAKDLNPMLYLCVGDPLPLCLLLHAALLRLLVPDPADAVGDLLLDRLLVLCVRVQLLHHVLGRDEHLGVGGWNIIFGDTLLESAKA